jgi:hypothetical protein
MSVIARQFGGRRYAYNWALAQVKANLDARAADRAIPALEWSLPRDPQGVEPGQARGRAMVG